MFWPLSAGARNAWTCKVPKVHVLPKRFDNLCVSTRNPNKGLSKKFFKIGRGEMSRFCLRLPGRIRSAAIECRDLQFLTDSRRFYKPENSFHEISRNLGCRNLRNWCSRWAAVHWRREGRHRRPTGPSAKRRRAGKSFWFESNRATNRRLPSWRPETRNPSTT